MKVKTSTLPGTEIISKKTTSKQSEEIANKKSKKIFKNINIKIEDKNWSIYERLRTNGVFIARALHKNQDNFNDYFLEASIVTLSNEQIFEILEELWLNEELNSSSYKQLLDKISKEKFFSKEKEQLEKFIFDFKKLEKEINPSASQSNRYKFFATLIGLSESIVFKNKVVDKAKTRAIFAKEAYASPNVFIKEALDTDLKKMNDNFMNLNSSKKKQVTRWNQNIPVEIFPIDISSESYTENKDRINSSIIFFSVLYGIIICVIVLLI